MSDPRCPRCGEPGPAGEGRIAVSFTMDELEEIAFATSNDRTRKRVICAISLIDEPRADAIATELRRNAS
jgi:hypothetical protein